MNILFIGDVCGKLGRKVLERNLSSLKKKYDIDFTIINGENITNGKGMNKKHYLFLKDIGADCITLGNHYNNKEEIYDYIDDSSIIVRPINIKDETHGVGTQLFDINGISIRVSNVLGQAFMNMKQEILDPYLEILKVIENDESDIHIIDFHAEATGEKKAFAYALKNTVTAVIGTHTHTQTNDAQILSTDIAFISDVGMCGSYNSVLGTEIDSVVNRIIKHDDKARFKLLEKDDMILNGCVIKIDDLNFKAKEIFPIKIIERMDEDEKD